MTYSESSQKDKAPPFSSPIVGNFWLSIHKKERIAFCELVIYKMVGSGFYTSHKMKIAAHYFAGRINHYYTKNDLETPLSAAQAWAWPETEDLLYRL
jgi:hypothetical protein